MAPALSFAHTRSGRPDPHASKATTEWLSATPRTRRQQPGWAPEQARTAAHAQQEGFGALEGEDQEGAAAVSMRLSTRLRGGTLQLSYSGIKPAHLQALAASLRSSPTSLKCIQLEGWFEVP